MGADGSRRATVSRPRSSPNSRARAQRGRVTPGGGSAGERSSPGAGFAGRKREEGSRGNPIGSPFGASGASVPGRSPGQASLRERLTASDNEPAAARGY